MLRDFWPTSNFQVAIPFLGLMTLGLVAVASPAHGSRPDGLERRARDFHFQSLYLGSSPEVLDWFSQIERRPSTNPARRIYEIYNPSPQVSLVVAVFDNNRLQQFELRYFDGEGIRTLTRAGGWGGLQKRLIDLFGPPTSNNPEVPVSTTQTGLDSRYALVNAEWVFPRVGRRVHFIAMQGEEGGVAVITFALLDPNLSTNPATHPLPPGKRPAWRADPGF